MSELVPAPLAEEFSGFLARRMGLHFPPERWPDMYRGLTQVAQEHALPDLAACMRWLLATPLARRQVEMLASHLTVGETYFNRDPTVFAAIEQHLLPPLIAARRASGQRSLRIWSAGCATGEEIYSVAIVLARLLPDLAEWALTLLATDINPDFLARAARGEYREWSFRGTPAHFRQAHFELTASGEFRLAEPLRRLPTFAYLNLIDDLYPALGNDTNGMDLVICRNVLLYFEPSAINGVLAKFRRSLCEGGWLIIGPSEASAAQLEGFTAVSVGERLFYRKPEPSPPPDLAELAAPPDERRPAAPPSSSPRRPPRATTFGRAASCYARGDYRETIELLAATAAADPRALALAARASANLGRLDDACRWGEAAVAADKFSPGLRYLLAAVLAEDGRVAAAEVALKQALYLDQRFVLAHFALGNLYRRQGRREAASRHFRHARELLATVKPEERLPDGDGLTAGRLLDILDSGEGFR